MSLKIHFDFDFNENVFNVKGRYQNTHNSTCLHQAGADLTDFIGRLYVDVFSRLRV